MPINVPYTLVPSLAGNTSFDEIEIDAGTISSGTVSLDLIWAPTPPTCSYEFPDGFTVAAGGTMAVGANVQVLLNSQSTLSDAGTVTFSSGDQVTLYYTALSVSGNLTANGTDFVNGGGGSNIAVNSGGDLIASASTFGVLLDLTSGSTDNLQYVAFNTQLTINSGATINITSDDFTNGTVVASGNANATISLINNFWGTINPTQIAAKITDHANNANLPYVTYEPFLSENATATYASNASVIYSPNAQTVTLSATVISADGPVIGGTETFTILSGSTDVGTPITENVANGAASGTYTIPAGTLGGVYTIQAVFSGTSTLSGSSDSSHTLTISDAATTTAAKSATTTFSASNQTISLSATVTSSAGIVDEGTETFTILSGTTPIGTPATADVSEGAVAASYALPGGTTGGTYTIEAAYNGTVDFGGSSDTSQTLTVSAAASATAAASASATYSAGDQFVALGATVTSLAGTVSEGTETFTILSGTTPIGTPATVNVSGGSASASYELPGGTAPGTYTIQAVYNGTSNFLGSSDSSHSLTVSNAATTTAASSATTTFSAFESDDIPERDCYQLGGHCQRRDRDLHDPQRDDTRWNPRDCRRFRRGRRCQLYAARWYDRRHLHDRGRLQRHGRFRRVQRHQSNAHCQRGGFGHRRRQRLGHLQRR